LEQQREQRELAKALKQQLERFMTSPQVVGFFGRLETQFCCIFEHYLGFN